MALIKCPECGKEISDKAKACPSCALPIAAITIEKTSKTYKALQLIFGLAIIIGIIIGIVGNDSDKGFGTIMTLAGLVGFIWVCIEAWWHHG